MECVKTHVRAHIHSVDDLARKLVLPHRLHQVLDLGIPTLDECAKEGFDLVPSLFNGMYVALRGAPFVTWSY